MVSQVTDAIEAVYSANIKDPNRGLSSIEINNFINHIQDCYCHINQADPDTNLAKFHQGIDSSDPSLCTSESKSIPRIMHDGNVPISKETMVATGTKYALLCGAFTNSWKDWNHIPLIVRTWAARKNHWTHAFEEQKTIQG